jgi:hypothetical protein
MAQVSGSDIVVALYDEATWSVNPNPAVGYKAYFSPPLDVAASQNPIQSDMMASGRGVPRAGRGNVDVTGSVTLELSPEQIGWWFKHALGAPTTSGASSPYTHVFVPKALPAGFQLEKSYVSKITEKVERFIGCRIGSMSLACPQEGFAKATFQISARRYTIVTAPLDATLTDLGHTGWTGFKGIVKRGGTQIGGVRDLNIQVDNELSTDVYTFPASGGTAGERFSLPEGRAVISGTMTLVFEDFTLVDLANAGTETTVEIIYSHGTGAGTATNEQLSILLDHVDIPLTSPRIETPSGMEIQVPFSAFASGADMGLEVTLKNALATV